MSQPEYTFSLGDLPPDLLEAISHFRRETLACSYGGPLTHERAAFGVADLLDVARQRIAAGDPAGAEVAFMSIAALSIEAARRLRERHHGRPCDSVLEMDEA